jgi:CRP-like cAMP-binding protein
MMALLNSGELHAGERTAAGGKAVKNKVLLSIPDDEFNAIRPHLELLKLPHHFSVLEPNQKVEFGYFLNSGMISLVVETEDGKTVEVGVVGKEGFAGSVLAVGLKRSSLREIVQIAGEGFRIAGDALQAVLATMPQLQLTLSRYTVLLGMQVAQTAACNRLHTVEQRLARWLLVTQDRVDAGMLPLTHDFLATMLGTDRPSVSLAADSFQRKQILQYGRGAVTILNRKELERLSCECYGQIQQFNGELGLR